MAPKTNQKQKEVDVKPEPYLSDEELEQEREELYAGLAPQNGGWFKISGRGMKVAGGVGSAAVAVVFGLTAVLFLALLIVGLFGVFYFEDNGDEA